MCQLAIQTWYNFARWVSNLHTLKTLRQWFKLKLQTLHPYHMKLFCFVYTKHPTEIDKMVKGKLEKNSHLIFLPPDNFQHRTSVSHHHNERAFGNISSTEHSVSQFAKLSARYFCYHLYSLCCLTSRSMCTERKKHIRLLCSPTLLLPSEYSLLASLRRLTFSIWHQQK